MPGEEHQPPSAIPAKKSALSIGTVLPLAAFALSLFSLYTSELARRDVARVDVIKTEYGLFHELAQIQLQVPLMEHLFATSGQRYDASLATIRAATASLSEPERARLLLQERAVAHYIFTTHEESYGLWQQALAGDKRRAQLALDDVLYFDDALCNNPRLLWYWDKSGGNMEAVFGKISDYLNGKVLKECPTAPDPKGPFVLAKEVPR